MNQLIGGRMIDTQEIKKKLEKAGLWVQNDLSAATKREDAAAFRVAVPVHTIGSQESYIEDPDILDPLMKKADQLTESRLQGLFPNLAYSLYTYGYDEAENQLIQLLVLMEPSQVKRKLPEVLKRLLRQ